MKKFLLATFINLIAITIFVGCAIAVRYDGPYEGRVIDADTGQPIAGVVVLGTWSREVITPGGATHSFYDAKETVTDKNGDFSIPGQGLLVLSNVIPVDVLMFKAGYEYFDSPWISLKESKYLIQKKNIKWEGGRAVIPLKKLAIEERRRQGTPSFPYEAHEKKKMPLLIKEINKEEKVLGRKPYPEE